MRWGVILGFTGALLPAVALAEPEATDRFDPVREVQLLGAPGIDIDTGWAPPGSAIQVRFALHFDDEVVASMPGDAVYDWGTGELYFDGDVDAGSFEVDVGVIVNGRMRFDLLGQQFETDLLGPYDVATIGADEFTPYLLEGNLDRPARVERLTDRSLLFEYALVDAIIASGTFFVDAAFDTQIELVCDAIDVVSAEGDEASIDVELQVGALPAPPDGADLQAEASLHCRTISTVVLLLYPGVELQVLGQGFELAPFELPVPALTDAESSFDFEALALAFEAPLPEAGSSSGGSSTGEPVGSSGDAPEMTSDGNGGGSLETEGDGASSTDAESGAVGSDAGTDTGPTGHGESLDGCGCTSAPSPSVPGWLVLVLAASLGRRRKHNSSSHICAERQQRSSHAA